MTLESLPWFPSRTPRYRAITLTSRKQAERHIWGGIALHLLEALDGLSESTEQRVLNVCIHSLGMPLDADRPPGAVASSGLDETVVGYSLDDQSGGQPVDALMMKGIHFQLRTSVPDAEQRARLEVNVVPPLVDFVGIGLLGERLVGGPGTGHILGDSAPQGHVEQLEAPADRQ